VDHVWLEKEHPPKTGFASKYGPGTTLCQISRENRQMQKSEFFKIAVISESLKDRGNVCCGQTSPHFSLFLEKN